MRKHRRPAFVALGLATALGITISGAAPISADTPLTKSGVYGVHYLADSAEYPGVTCRHNSATVITSIRVRGPFVYARNRIAGVETQAVSWQFAVQARSPGTATWTTVAASATQKRTTTDVRVADFTPLTKSFTGSAAREYRVLVVMRWFGAGGTTEVGRVTHRIDWYAWTGVPSFHGLCPGGLF